MKNKEEDKKNKEAEKKKNYDARIDFIERSFLVQKGIQTYYFSVWQRTTREAPNIGKVEESFSKGAEGGGSSVGLAKPQLNSQVRTPNNRKNIKYTNSSFSFSGSKLTSFCEKCYMLTFKI
jgi:hypothetical protein